MWKLYVCWSGLGCWVGRENGLGMYGSVIRAMGFSRVPVYDLLTPSVGI